MKASFGSVRIFGQKYEKDIVMHTDGSVTKRKKKKSKDLKSIYGHTPLSEYELDFLGKKNLKLYMSEQAMKPLCP